MNHYCLPQEYMRNPTVTRTTWATRCCWLATVLREDRTTGSSKTGQGKSTIAMIVPPQQRFLEYIFLKIFSVGGPVGGKAATCASFEMARTRAASPATPCTPSCDSESSSVSVPAMRPVSKRLPWFLSSEMLALAGATVRGTSLRDIEHTGRDI